MPCIRDISPVLLHYDDAQSALSYYSRRPVLYKRTWRTKSILLRNRNARHANGWEIGDGHLEQDGHTWKVFSSTGIKFNCINGIPNSSNKRNP